MEAFIVVRAVNLDSPQYYSDASVGLILQERVRRLEFSSPLYRFIMKENTPVGTVINSEKISLLGVDAKLPNIQLRLNNSEFLEFFDVLKNGSLITRRPIDLERFPDQSNGIIDLTVNNLW